MHKHAELATSKSYTKWMITVLPASLAVSPLGTFIPLYILSIGGSALNVALAFMAFNAVSMITTFVWGNLVDATGKRKPFIMLSYIGTTFLLFLMYFATSIPNIIAIYAAIALFGAASITPYNLLVMETDVKENWSRSFSRLQAISNIGMIIGLIIASFITQFTGFKVLILVFAFASLISTLFAAKFIIEPKVPVHKESMIKQIDHIAFLMVSYPFRFIRFKHVRQFGSSNRNFLTKLKTPFALMCIAWLLFNIGMSIFNTEYVASLHIHGLSDSTLFFMVFVCIVVQTILFYYALRILNRNKLHEAVKIMTGLRVVIYVLVGLSFLISAGIIFFLVNLVLYATVSGMSYALYYTASYTLLFMVIGDGKRGSELGIYNGVGWVGYFLGAVFAGVVVFTGFTLLYIFAAVWIVASLYVFNMAHKRSEVKKDNFLIKTVAIPGN